MHAPAGTAPRARVYLAYAIVSIVWGSTYLGIAKALHGGALPLTMVSGSRFIIAGGLTTLLQWHGTRKGFSALGHRPSAIRYSLFALGLLFILGILRLQIFDLSYQPFPVIPVFHQKGKALILAEIEKCLYKGF